MTKTNPIQTIQELAQSALGDINSAATLADLEKVRVAVLGRKGELAGMSKNFGMMAPEDRARAGQLLNEAKTTLEKALDDRKAALAGSESDQKLKAEWIDLSIPPKVSPSTRSVPALASARRCDGRRRSSSHRAWLAPFFGMTGGHMTSVLSPPRRWSGLGHGQGTGTRQPICHSLRAPPRRGLQAAQHRARSARPTNDRN